MDKKLTKEEFLDKYEFMYRFLGYGVIDSDFITIGIEEAPMNSNHIYQELKNRKSKSKNGYYTNELLEFFGDKKISENYYWQIPIDIFSKITGKYINESEIFYGEYNPFPKVKSNIILDDLYLIDGLDNYFKKDNKLRFKNRKSEISKLITGKSKNGKKIILISLYEFQIKKLFLNEKFKPICYFEYNDENIEYCNSLKGKNEKNILEYHNNDGFYIYKLDSGNIIASIPHLQSIENYPKVIDSLVEKIKVIL